MGTPHTVVYNFRIGRLKFNVILPKYGRDTYRLMAIAPAITIGRYNGGHHSAGMLMVPSEGLEPPTLWSVARCSDSN